MRQEQLGMDETCKIRRMGQAIPYGRRSWRICQNVGPETPQLMDLRVPGLSTEGDLAGLRKSRVSDQRATGDVSCNVRTGIS